MSRGCHAIVEAVSRLGLFGGSRMMGGGAGIKGSEGI